jgi:leucyl aminopeptidase
VQTTHEHVISGLELVIGAARDVDADLLVVPVFEDDALDDVEGLEAATGGESARARASQEFTGKLYDLFLTPSDRGAWRARRVGLIGAGSRAEYSTDRLRRLATAAGSAARQRRVPSAAFVVRGWPDLAAAAQAVAEGLTLSEFDGGVYKTADRLPSRGPGLQVVSATDADGAVRRAVQRGRVLGDSCNIARALCNEPSNVLTPSVFAVRAERIARDAGLGVAILDEHEIARLQMGLLLGVARGSVEPPRVIVLRHDPPGAPAAPVLGLVGKGITFDTGGVSIKPAEGMERMKDDMAGGAAVICAMRAIALLQAPIRVIGVVPATENMVSGQATKPGDVLTSASGTTVEVINTDAEGRLVLGDGLWYARELGATHLVDVATLTGACVVALGKAASGLFGAPDGWRDFVGQVAARAGDRCWPMPLFEEYADQLKSEIADLLNTGGRPAGAATAAMFIKGFAAGRPWAHLDIAGTAWAEEAKPFQPKGATGVAVRTLAELAFTSDSWTL